ncbi:hypothetical protein EJ04DRAFT_472874, partial [Polyplosphaeria fusca]
MTISNGDKTPEKTATGTIRDKNDSPLQFEATKASHRQTLHDLSSASTAAAQEAPSTTKSSAQEATLPTTKSSALTALSAPPTQELISTASSIAAEISFIHTTLLTLPTLSPHPRLNSLLTRLVHLCTAPYPPPLVSLILSTPPIPSITTSLRTLCALSESALESHWSSYILSSPNASAALQKFPYHENYQALCAVETYLLTPFLPSPPKNITFIGSGPLPLSSIHLSQTFPAAHVWNLDRDAPALTAGHSLCAALGVAQRMAWVQRDVHHLAPEREDWEDSEVVFLAALV